MDELTSTFLAELEHELTPLIRYLTIKFRENTEEVTLPQLHVLKLVSQNEDSTAKEISRKYNVSMAAMSQTISQLIDKGFIEKTQAQEDRRAYILSVTLAGREVLSKNRTKRQEALAELLEPLTQEQQQELLKLLATLRISLGL